MPLKIFCFGEFEVFRKGNRIAEKHLGGNKARHLLKVLLAKPGSFFTKDQLIEYLWGQQLPEDPQKALRNCVYQLRKALEPEVHNGEGYQLIRTSAEGYAFCVKEDHWIDTQIFETHLQTAQSLVDQQRWNEALPHLQQAMDLYRGDFLQEDRYEDWTTLRRSELQEKYCQALAWLAEGHARQENYQKAIECSHKAIIFAPGNEGLHRQLMQYYCYVGSRDKAIKTFETLKAYLKKAVGVEPEAPTLALYQRILKGEITERSRAGQSPIVASAQAIVPELLPGSAQRKASKAMLVSSVVAIGALTVLLAWYWLGLQPTASTAQIPPVHFFQNDNTPFKDLGNFPPVMVDFDDLAPGTDLTGKAINGVRFERSSPSSAPPIVVRGWETVTPAAGYRCEPLGDPATHKLFPTTGANVLSPGGLELAPGPNPALEDDDLVLTFDNPVGAVGFDILWQSADGSRRTVTLQDKNGKAIFSQEFGFDLGAPGMAPPGGSSFVGFISEANNIAKVIVDEFDNDNCRENANGGYDTIYFKTLAPNPEPVEDYSFLRQWGGSAGTNPGQFNSDSGPRGIALVQQEGATLVYVSDYVNNRIQEFDSEGRFIAQYPVSHVVQDLEYDGHGAFYLRAVGPDSPAGNLVKLDSQFNELWAAEAPAAEWVSYGLCIDSDGNIHVPVALSTAPGDHKMYKYDPNGNLLAQYGAGLVKGNASCEASRDGLVYVFDGSTTNLRIFSNAGELQDTIRVGRGISALAVDKEGHFFLAERFMGKNVKVRKYDAGFKLLAEWGGEGQGNGLFSTQVRDIEIDDQGLVYISDGKNLLIQVFQLQ